MVVESIYEFGLRKGGCLTIGTFLHSLWLWSLSGRASPVGAHREMFIPTSFRSFLIGDTTKAPSERYNVKMDEHADKNGDFGL
jgi:hypothetical protein